MNLPDKLLLILVAFAAASPLGAGMVAEDAAPAPSVASVLYAPEAAGFRALIVNGRLAAAAGMDAGPVCVPTLAFAPAGPHATGVEPPPGPIQRVLAGPVAAAYAGGMGRDAPAARDPLPGFPSSMPAPEGWKLFLCGLGILAFIAVRRARGIG